jgi:hypothetical protein
MRLRNLAVIVIPAVAIGAAAFAVYAFDPRLGAGALAVAVVPAPLVAPGLVGRIRGRADLAGALVLGTVALSLLVVGSRGAVAAAALFTATQAFALPAMFANALPTVRDAILAPLRVIGWIACGAVIVLGVVAAPTIDVWTIVVAVLLLDIGGISAAVVAFLTGRDVAAAVGGAGLRDGALAIALATAIGADLGVAVVYALGGLVVGTVALMRA